MPPAFRDTIESLEDSVEALAEGQREAEDSVTSLKNDEKCATKTELRLFVNGKAEALNDMIENLNDKIASLEKAAGILSKENHSLKTQLGTIHSEMKKMKPSNVIHPCSDTLAAALAALPKSPAMSNTSMTVGRNKEQHSLTRSPMKDRDTHSSKADNLQTSKSDTLTNTSCELTEAEH